MTYNPTKFSLVKVSLIRGVGCPKELQASYENTSSWMPIVVVANKQGYSATPHYTPGAVIVAGAQKRDMLLSQGVNRSWLWLEAGALDGKADDTMGTNELMQKLQASLTKRIYGSATVLSVQPTPFVTAVYPFENYCTFSFNANKYRQHFDIDPAGRNVVLAGTAIELKSKSIDATVTQMQRVQTGVRYAFAPPTGDKQSSTTGAPNSELVTQIVRNWADIAKAVGAYLAAIKNGQHVPMRPSFYPVDIVDGKVGAVLQAAKVDAYDFAAWSWGVQQKIKAGGPGSGRHAGDATTKLADRAIQQSKIAQQATDNARTPVGHKEAGQAHKAAVSFHKEAQAKYGSGTTAHVYHTGQIKIHEKAISRHQNAIDKKPHGRFDNPNGMYGE